MDFQFSTHRLAIPRCKVLRHNKKYFKMISFVGENIRSNLLLLQSWVYESDTILRSKENLHTIERRKLLKWMGFWGDRSLRLKSLCQNRTPTMFSSLCQTSLTLNLSPFFIIWKSLKNQFQYYAYDHLSLFLPPVLLMSFNFE